MDRRPNHRRHHRRAAPAGAGKPAGPALADFPGAICARCQKPESLCVCDAVTPIANRIAVLILQHPQEQDKVLGSAGLAVRHLANATLRVGLSWPSLAKALGPLAERVPTDPRRWAVLYLGAVRAADLPKGREVVAVDAKGKPVADQSAALAGLAGIAIFDGTWSQAKTLWWRNPWVLKMRRIVLAPSRPSRYGALRREPRREGLSTLEAAALTVARLEARPEIETALSEGFEHMLAKYRSAKRGLGENSASPSP
jgi:DTW domain-containing protein YfiP